MHAHTSFVDSTDWPDRGDPAETPVRLICRHSSRLLLARAQRWAPLLPFERVAGLAFQTILSAGIAHLPLRDPASGAWIGIDALAADARPVSVFAVTQSLDLPYSSTARRVNDTVGTGMLLKERRGLRVAPAFFAGGRLDAVTAADRAELVRAIDLLAAAGYDPVPSLRDGGLERVPAAVVSRVLLAYALRSLESVKHLYGDIISGMLAVTVIGANVEHLFADPMLDLRFGGQDRPPPDALRRPVTVRELARRADMPFETVRRRVSALRTRGVLELRGDGIILPARVLMDDAQLADNVRIAGHFQWLLATLSDLASAAA